MLEKKERIEAILCSVFFLITGLLCFAGIPTTWNRPNTVTNVPPNLLGVLFLIIFGLFLLYMASAFLYEGVTGKDPDAWYGFAYQSGRILGGHPIRDKFRKSPEKIDGVENAGKGIEN